MGIVPAPKLNQHINERTPIGDPFVIEPYLSESTDAGLDVRLGNWFLTPKKYATGAIDLLQEHQAIATKNRHPLTSHKSLKPYYVGFKRSFVLHPRSFVLAATLEWVRMPRSFAAYVVGKSSLGRLGLVVATATGIQPGFSGCITLELVNMGELPMHLYPGMQIAQIFVHTVEPNVEPNAIESNSAELENLAPHVGFGRPSGGFYRFDKIAAQLAKTGLI